MKSGQKNVSIGFVRVIIVFTVIVIGVIFLLHESSADVLPGALTAIALVDWPTLAAILALSLANYFLRYGRWAMYVGRPPLPISHWRHLAIYIAGFALTVTPTKAGEAIRALYLKPFGVTYHRCFAALYAERVMDVMVMSGLSALILLQTTGAVRWLGLAGAGLAVLLVALQHPIVLRLSERLVTSLPGERMRNLGVHVLFLQREVSRLMRLRAFALAMGIGILAWGAEGVGLYLVAQQLGLDLGFWPAIGIYAIAVLAGALTFLPGGLGGTELVMISLLVSAQASPAAAIAITAIVRVATLWFAVALGAAAWLGIETTTGSTFSRWGHSHSEE